jgi:microcompartment protein CcmL/EutN
MPYPQALGVLELDSIARGWRVLDDMVKRAPVTVRSAQAVSGGKFLIFVSGDIAPVEEAMSAGKFAAKRTCFGDVLLTYCHLALWEGLDGRFGVQAIDALGLIESRSVADTLCGADAALKAAEVRLACLHLAQGIDGKAYFGLSGALADVEVALDAATSQMRSQHIVELELMARPHDDMTLTLLKLPTIHQKY